MAEQLAQGRPLVQHAPASGLPPRLRCLPDTLWEKPEPLVFDCLHYEAVVLELVAQQIALWLASVSATRLPLGAPERDKLHHALLLQQLAGPPTLAELACQCQLNEFSFNRRFRQLVGRKAGSFGQDWRLEAARHLRLGGDRTAPEIACQLGYAPLLGFSKHCGLMP